MSRDFFGFKVEPFSVHPDNRYFFSSISHDRAITLLEYGINSRKGFMLLTGLKGTGKTMTCSILREGLSGVNTVVVSSGIKEPGKLLEDICSGFGLDRASSCSQSAFGCLMDFFVGEYKDGRNNLIIIDDAEGISDESLELLNSFLDIEIEQCKLVQVILCGSPALHDRLKNVSSRLGPKFTFTVELAALSLKDTADYVEHRLKKALGDEFPLFRKSSYVEIYHYTKGIPSEINRVAQKAIEIANDSKASRVNAAHVKQAAAMLYGVSRRRTVNVMPVAAVFLLMTALVVYLLMRDGRKDEVAIVEPPAVTQEQAPVVEEPAAPAEEAVQPPVAEAPAVEPEPEPVKPEPVKEEPPAAVVPAHPEFGCVTAGSGLKIRKTPSRNAASIGNAPYRSKVVLISHTDDGEWWQVRFKGVEGYMFAEFVKPTESGECR
ncbi:AAA family ATPase [Seleniivibrio woodruffii]|uniref:General secretion pathway protein A n=1 Tax=Seleniivibrio woodruffii TaxID=1078050 RepID=A0A4R1K9M4_9BACT|nr:AAA family ATPase [Seleniivibrio woodruffii]TCK60573.1 general secretion pathway protein A [Seleniivibrio woodruffii]TVZ36202.1 general secretion pathway protein A [Seleniivibrio woodruffii]